MACRFPRITIAAIRHLPLLVDHLALGRRPHAIDQLRATTTR
jgi:hypothetical protein